MNCDHCDEDDANEADHFLCDDCACDVEEARAHGFGIGWRRGAAVAFGLMGMAEAAAYRMFDVAKEAYHLWKRGYDGPFMGDEIEPLFKALAALDAVGSPEIRGTDREEP